MPHSPLPSLPLFLRRLLSSTSNRALRREVMRREAMAPTPRRGSDASASASGHDQGRPAAARGRGVGAAPTRSGDGARSLAGTRSQLIAGKAAAAHQGGADAERASGGSKDRRRDGRVLAAEMAQGSAASSEGCRSSKRSPRLSTRAAGDIAQHVFSGAPPASAVSLAPSPGLRSAEANYFTSDGVTNDAGRSSASRGAGPLGSECLLHAASSASEGARERHLSLPSQEGALGEGASIEEPWAAAPEDDQPALGRGQAARAPRMSIDEAAPRVPIFSDAAFSPLLPGAPARYSWPLFGANELPELSPEVTALSSRLFRRGTRECRESR